MKLKLPLLLTLIFLLAATAVGGCGTLAATPKTETANYPSHEIKLIVPFDAGSGGDIHIRILQKIAAKYLDYPLVIINKSGGGGTIGLHEIAKAEPDGYTIGLSAPEVIFHSVYGTAKYHYLTALDPLAQIVSTPFFLVVNVESPWNSVEDLILYGKSIPLKFAHGGIGSASHVVGESFAKATSIKSLQVPFRGGGEKTNMILGNHVDAIFINLAPVKEHIKNGKLKILATTSPTRIKDPALADIPTLKELGIDVEYTDWYGIAAPKPLPPEIKAKLAADLKKMILDPEFKAAVEKLGTQLDYLGPEESQEKWIQDAERLKKIVAETGIAEQIQKLQPKSKQQKQNE